MGRLARTRKHRRTVGHKQQKRKLHFARDLDLVQKDLQQGKAPPGDLEDLPARGQYFCTPCSRYFVDQATLDAHLKTKKHKRRLKLLRDPAYTQADAEAAAGMAPPKND
eukprot:gnl/Trimastix_PCT/962.p2 GENE.gnl/Trimastix_PCT/962~~gnl/Trimastix_PCT/962.p2  ORF type:complete len:109 (-),score=17.49 gnl/Trimastix_PCT/962:158-484(-)